MSDLTPQQINEALKTYHAAIEEEFAATKSDSTTVSELITDFARDKALGAAARIYWMSEHAQSDGTRFAACKWIIDRADNAGGEDSINRLFRELQTEPQSNDSENKVGTPAGKALPYARNP